MVQDFVHQLTVGWYFIPSNNPLIRPLLLCLDDEKTPHLNQVQIRQKTSGGSRNSTISSDPRDPPCPKKGSTPDVYGDGKVKQRSKKCLASENWRCSLRPFFSKDTWRVHQLDLMKDWWPSDSSHELCIPDRWRSPTTVPKRLPAELPGTSDEDLKSQKGWSRSHHPLFLTEGRKNSPKDSREESPFIGDNHRIPDGPDPNPPSKPNSWIINHLRDKAPNKQTLFSFFPGVLTLKKHFTQLFNATLCRFPTCIFVA